MMEMFIENISDSASAMEANSTTTEQLHQSSWFQCSSGKLLQPLDILQYIVFPTQRHHTGRYFCTIPSPLTFSGLNNLLPPPSKFFAPSDLVDTIVASFAVCLFVTIAMVILKIGWEQVDQRFNSIQPAHKKWYVVAYLCKGILLSFIAFSSGYWRLAYDFLVARELTSLEILQLKRCAVIMVTPDVVGLFMVPKMPKSSVMHHAASGVFLLLVSSIDYTTYEPYGLPGMCRMIASYGILIVIAFPLYAYVAMRIVYPKASWLSVLAKLALLSYGAYYAFNMIVQSLWVIISIARLQITLYTVFYLLIFPALFWPDTVFLQFLIKMNSIYTEVDRKRQHNE